MKYDMLYLVIIIVNAMLYHLYFFFVENARRIRANDREYNSQFHYAVSVRRVEQIE
jgi:hypothetical protein